MPLTTEQQSVDFQTADLTFDVQPKHRRLEGQAVLGFLVKAPIAKLQFDLDPELAIKSIAADGTALPDSAWKNDGGLVTVNLPSSKQAGDRLSLTVAYGGHPHVAKRAPWDGGFVWSQTTDGQPVGRDRRRGRRLRPVLALHRPTDGQGATVDQHIIVPRPGRALATAACSASTSSPTAGARWNWRAKHPNTYGIAINVAPYQLLQGDYHSRYGNRDSAAMLVPAGEEAQAQELFTEMIQTIGLLRAHDRPLPLRRLRRWAWSKPRTWAWSIRPSMPTAISTSRAHGYD